MLPSPTPEAVVTAATSTATTTATATTAACPREELERVGGGEPPLASSPPLLGPACASSASSHPAAASCSPSTHSLSHPFQAGNCYSCNTEEDKLHHVNGVHDDDHDDEDEDDVNVHDDDDAMNLHHRLVAMSEVAAAAAEAAAAVEDAEAAAAAAEAQAASREVGGGGTAGVVAPIVVTATVPTLTLQEIGDMHQEAASSSSPSSSSHGCFTSSAASSSFPAPPSLVLPHDGNPNNNNNNIHNPNNNNNVREPARMDILCGRGASVNSHPGNQKFRALCFARKPEFDIANHAAKRRVSAEIVTYCQNHWGSRFLKRASTATSTTSSSTSQTKETNLKSQNKKRKSTDEDKNDDEGNNNINKDKNNNQEEEEVEVWVEMTTEQAILKASQVMRDYKRPDRLAQRQALAAKNSNYKYKKRKVQNNNYDLLIDSTNVVLHDNNNNHNNNNNINQNMEQAALLDLPVGISTANTSVSTAITSLQGSPAHPHIPSTLTHSSTANPSAPLQPIVENPFGVHDHDVLCGRGAYVNGHVGNLRLRELAMERKVAFDRGNYTEKRGLATEIVMHIRNALNPPGRFLQRVSAMPPPPHPTTNNNNKDNTTITMTMMTTANGDDDYDNNNSQKKNSTASTSTTATATENTATTFHFDGVYTWEELSDERAIHKACQVMRDIARPDRKHREERRKIRKMVKDQKFAAWNRDIMTHTTTSTPSTTTTTNNNNVNIRVAGMDGVGHGRAANSTQSSITIISNNNNNKNSNSGGSGGDTNTATTTPAWTATDTSTATATVMTTTNTVPSTTTVSPQPLLLSVPNQQTPIEKGRAFTFSSAPSPGEEGATSVETATATTSAAVAGEELVSLLPSSNKQGNQEMHLPQEEVQPQQQVGGGNAGFDDTPCSPLTADAAAAAAAAACVDEAVAAAAEVMDKVLEAKALYNKTNNNHFNNKTSNGTSVSATQCSQNLLYGLSSSTVNNPLLDQEYHPNQLQRHYDQPPDNNYNHFVFPPASLTQHEEQHLHHEDEIKDSPALHVQEVGAVMNYND